jgi:threonine/homoserine/homoserine lactone efflux protein
MFLIIIIAFALGAVTSIPLGAVGQLMFNRLMKEGFRASLAIGLFSALLDAMYCEIALIGISLVFDSTIIRSVVQGLGLLVLLYYGHKHLLPMKRSAEKDNERTVELEYNRKSNWFSHVKHFAAVIIITMSSPTLIAFWINMAHVLHSSVLADRGVREYTLFSITVGLGSAFCQYVVLRIARDVRLFHSPTRRMIIQWLSTSIFMLAISYFIYHFIEELLLNTI